MSAPRAVGEEAAGWMAAVHAEGFDRPWSPGAFTDLLRQPNVTALALDWDGFIVIQAVLEEAEVLTLAVRADARRRGAARALVEAAARHAAEAGARVLRLEVACDNAEAQALYAATGFAEVGLRRRYYARPDSVAVDARVLARTLNSGGG